MTNEKKLIGSELCNYLEHNGIVHEINRTFLHPLGINLKINREQNEIELWKTEDDKGYLLEKINPMHKQVFQKLSASKHSHRQRTLGFGIQTKDIFRSENLKGMVGLLIAPERLKLELIMSCLSSFAHLIYCRIIQKHDKKDKYFEPDQFSKERLLRLLLFKVKQENWEDVAAYAMMLGQNEELNKGIKEIQIKAEEYNNYKSNQ